MHILFTRPGRPVTRRGAGLATSAVAAATAAALAVTGLSLAGPADAAAPTTGNRVQAAAGWLSTQFENASHLPAPDGDHFDNEYGKAYYANYGENADAAFGLAAAHAGRAAIRKAVGYLGANLEAYTDYKGTDGGPYDGSLGKTALAVEVAGASPRSFAGQNLLDDLAEGECTTTTTSCETGEYENSYNTVGEAYVLLAIVRAGRAVPAAATTYFDSLQCSSGGFTLGPAACGTGAADVDATSYAIMALTALGAGQDAQRTRAADWLADQQSTKGYWTEQGIANTDSTGLATAALQGAESSSGAVGRARTWLLSQQVGAGGAGAGALKYAGTVSATTTSATSPSVDATAQGLTGLVNGGGLATVTADGAAYGVEYFATTVDVSHVDMAAGSTQRVVALGFAAGERVRVQLRGARTVTGTASPLGVLREHIVLARSARHGRTRLELTGLSSGLTGTRSVTIVS